MDPQVPIQDQIPNNKSQITNGAHNITVISMAIFVLLALGAVVFLYYQNQQLKKMLAKYQNPNPSPTALATADPTANWKTYTNTLLKYSLKHPTDWLIDESKDPIISICSPSKVCLTIHNSSYKFEAFFSNLTAGNKVTILQPPQDTHLTNVDAKSFQISTMTGPYEQKIQYFYIAGSNNSNVVLSYYLNSESDSSFNQILSTFKFIGPTKSPSASPVACTLDAKVCPDGSAVGRTGPNCEFAPCPTPK